MTLSLAKAERYINGVVPNYSSVKLVPRSVPFFVDKVLRGDARFSKKVGNNIGIICPDITAELAEDLTVLHNIFEVTSLQQWFTSGSIVEFWPDVEYKFIQDVSYSANTIILASSVDVVHNKGSKVFLYAVPVTAKSTVTPPATSTQIIIESSYFIAVGDQLGIPVISTSIGSILWYNIVQATYDTGSGYYILTVDRPIKETITTDYTLYIRAYPAYTSDTIILPSGNTSTNRYGPMLVDYLSGRLVSDLAVSEYLSMTILSQQGNAIYGTSNTPAAISKNSVIDQISMRADVTLFWNISNGSFQYKKNGNVILLPDSTGKFTCYTELIPNLVAGQEWKVPVEATIDANISFKFHSDDEPTITFENEHLVSFTYDSLTGVVQYNNTVDLSDVEPGQSFVDSDLTEHTIFTVEAINNKVYIASNTTVSTTTPTISSHGSIHTGNAVRTFNLTADTKSEVIVGTNVLEENPKRIEISASPAFAYKNKALVSFTYDQTTGVVQYLSAVDLSAVAVNDKFLDSFGTQFNVISVDDSLDQIVLTTGLVVKTYTPTRPLQGAIYSNYDNLQVEVSDWEPTVTKIYRFRNINLVTYTYVPSPGVILFSGSPELHLFGITAGDRFIDSAYNEFVITSSGSNYVAITVPTGVIVDVTTPIEFNQGSIVRAYTNETAYSLTYTMVARAKDNWLGSGLILKRMFLSVEDLSAKYDTNHKYNGGSIYL